MGSHIEAVKNCVKKVRDDLVQQFQGCDIRFAFVRYTDYDQPEYNRTTHIDFTKYECFGIQQAYVCMVDYFVIILLLVIWYYT